MKFMNPEKFSESETEFSEVSINFKELFERAEIVNE